MVLTAGAYDLRAETHVWKRAWPDRVTTQAAFGPCRFVRRIRERNDCPISVYPNEAIGETSKPVSVGLKSGL